MYAARALSRAARTAAPRVARPAAAPRAVAVRSYAQAANTQSVKPPVALYGVDGTYASALVRFLPSSPPNCPQLAVRRDEMGPNWPM